MHISVISGSPRKDSNSLKVARAISKAFAGRGHQVLPVVDFHDSDIPMVGRGSLKADALSPFQSALIGAIRGSQICVFVVPEYNWITSGEIINAIHQIGNKELADVFHDRIFALTGVSSGRGGRRPALEMQTLISKMISFLDKRGFVSPRLFESHETEKNVGEDGESLGNELYDRTLQSFADYALDMASMWFAGR
ncbi:MAG: NAD(P)H-dependent oxidoreductase [Leptospiraceae bacterium]|nr:NAD(P)H-dependent oxidoreductase [Leptospiraceae bacterium]